MHFSFSGLLALSHHHHALAGIAEAAFVIGVSAAVMSKTALENGRKRLGWLLATLCLTCFLLRNGTDMGEWVWTFGGLTALWLAIKTQPKYDVKRYGNAPLAYLLFYWLGLTLVMMPTSDYWYSPQHLFHHYQQAWNLVGIGLILLVIGGVLHYRAWQLPPPLSKSNVQKNQKVITEKAHSI